MLGIHKSMISKEGFQIGALLFRLFFAALFFFAAINSTSEGVSALADDFARVYDVRIIGEREFVGYLYFFVLAFLFTTGGLMLLFRRKVPHIYAIAAGLYLTYTIWQISTGTLPATADQYVPTLFGLFIAFLVEEKASGVEVAAPPSAAVPM
jgi:hypothetical protein